VRVFSGVLLTKEEVEQLGRYSEGDDPVRLISIGRLLHWKGFHYGLRAFAEAKPSRAEYWIVGDGPERSRLETLTRALGLEKRVHFWGALDREETLTKLGKCHILVHPSLHDSGGSVCLEAMAAGRPVVCLNTGGPATLITEEAGFKVAITDPYQTVHDLANAITRLIHDPDLRTRMGSAGRRRVREINWETRGSLWIKLYKEILLGKP
jgi:glycosyltransferase involved in cell wall biosynthesis